MGLFDFLKKKAPKNDSAQRKSIVLSQYSTMPRYFTIGNKTYDIDNPEHIKRLTIFSNVMTVNGGSHGMDYILLNHGAQAKSQNNEIYEAAIRKVKRYWDHGVRSVPETDDEVLSEEPSVQASIDSHWTVPDPISPEEYNRKREIERQYLESKYDFNSI